MKYISTKTYGHDLGLSCCFRQWRATHSHCRFLHGYAISVHFEFSAQQLDERNWVMDFGGLKQVKKFLEQTFDHKTIVASDDPLLETFKGMDAAGLIDLVIMPDVGCEKFAEFIMFHVKQLLPMHVSLDLVEVREHGANSAKVLQC